MGMLDSAGIDWGRVGCEGWVVLLDNLEGRYEREMTRQYVQVNL